LPFDVVLSQLSCAFKSRLRPVNFDQFLIIVLLFYSSTIFEHIIRIVTACSFYKINKSNFLVKEFAVYNLMGVQVVTDNYLALMVVSLESARRFIGFAPPNASGLNYLATLMFRSPQDSAPRYLSADFIRVADVPSR